MNTAFETWPVLSWLWLVEGIAFYALLQWSWAHTVPGVRAFRGLVFGSMLFVSAEALNLTIPAGALRYWLSGISCLGVGIILPNLAVLFADFTGRNRWLTPSFRKTLYAIGLLIGLAKFGDPWWGLVYRTETIVLQQGLYVSEYQAGIVHYILMSGIIAAMLLGLVNVGLAWRSATQLMRRHLVALAVSCLIPVVSAVLFNAGFQPWGSLELTPFALLATAGLTGWAIFHDRLVEIVPIARSYLVDNLADGVLVADVAKRVVDSNPALRRMLGLDEKGILGQPVGAVVKNWPALADICGQETTGQIELQPAIGGEIHWNATWCPLQDARGKPHGFLLTLADISIRKRAESNLHDLVAERTREWREATRNLLRAGDDEKRRLGTSLQHTFCAEFDRIRDLAESLASPDGNASSSSEKLRRLISLIATTHDKLKEFANLLEGPDLAHQSFKQALTTVLSELHTTLGAKCELEIAPDFQPPSRERARHLIEAAREAVISSVQIGHSKTIKVILQNRPDGQNMTIEDDGRARSEKELSSGGTNGGQLRLRANLLGGRLTISRAAANGTVVELFLPPQKGSDTTPGFFPA